MDANTNGSIAILPSTVAGKKVKARLSDDRTLNAIDNLLARIDTLDKVVANLTTMMNQAPGLLAMGGDMLDEAYRKADAQGVSIDERLNNALVIAEKLTAPAMVEKLDKLTQFADQLPGLVAMKVDALDDMYREADANGVNIDERLSSALQLAEKLTAPEMVEKLNGLMATADQLPGMIAMTVDMVDERMKNAIANGFDPNVLADTASAANRALTNARAEPPAKVGGIFGLLKVLKDPDRQRGLGFLMNFLKHFGKNI